MAEDLLRFGLVGAPAQTPPPGGTPAGIQYLKLLGLQHLEIAWTRSVRISDEACAQIKATAQTAGLTLSVHAPYFINLNSQTPEKMAASDERLLAAARAGHKAGARDIIFHPASYHGQPPREVYPRVRDQLASIVATLQAEGVDVTLRPETMGKGAMFGDLDEVIQLSVDVPNVLPCIDWAHLYARTGDGTFNTRDTFHAALDKIGAALGDDGLHRMHCHMSGISYTLKGEKAHIPLNECQQDYFALLQAFIDYGVRATIACEAPDPFHVADALVLQATYRRLRDNVPFEAADE